MEIKNIEIDKIKPYPNNPRNNRSAIKSVAESIERFGFQQPLVLDKNFVIVVGHTRFEASKKLGLKTVPCVIADRLSEEQVKAYRLVDNKVGELARWDFELLQNEILEIEEIDMQDFGFENMDFDLDSFFEEKQIEEFKEKKESPQFIECENCGAKIKI